MRGAVFTFLENSNEVSQQVPASATWSFCRWTKTLQATGMLPEGEILASEGGLETMLTLSFARCSTEAGRKALRAAQFIGGK